MHTIKDYGALLLALTFLAGTCRAEDKSNNEPQRFYRLDFLVKEMDGGKVLNSRAYSMQVATQGGDESIRTGSKVPVLFTAGQWSQVDVGTSIDCRDIKELDGQLSLRLVAEVSSILQDSLSSEHPIVRQNRWGSLVILKLKKPTVVFSSDDTSSKHQMQLEVTANSIP